MANRVQPEVREAPVLQEVREPLEPLDLQEHQATLVLKVHQDHLEMPVQLAQLELLVPKDLLGKEVMLGLQDLLDRLVHLAQPDQRERMEILLLLKQQDYQKK